MKKNTDIPTELLPEEDKVIGGVDGLDYDHLVVFIPGGQAMIMEDFRREYLNGENSLRPDEYAVMPANENGEVLFNKETKGRLLKQLWGYNPLS
jgi:hypothetical protein